MRSIKIRQRSTGRFEMTTRQIVWDNTGTYSMKGNKKEANKIGLWRVKTVDHLKAISGPINLISRSPGDTSWIRLN